MTDLDGADDPVTPEPPAGSPDDDLLSGAGPEAAGVVGRIREGQDELIHAPAAALLLIEGGPGTGKTMTALRRAARLVDGGELLPGDLLVIGPSAEFARYTAGVLAGWGLAGAAHCTLGDLLPRVPGGRDETPYVNRLKGEARMAGLLARALAERRGQAAELPSTVLVHGRAVPVNPVGLRAVVATAKASSAGPGDRQRLLRGVLAAAADDPRLVTAAADRLAELLWPTFTPDSFLRELFGSPGLLTAAAADEFTDRELASLHRPDDEATWSEADLPLLDELDHLLNGHPHRYAHVVVDEAQDLSPMQARAVARRSATGSITIVGDVAQSTGPWARDDWQDLLANLPSAMPRLHRELRFGYRVPRQIFELAAELLPTAAPAVLAPTTVRDGPANPVIAPVTPRDRPGVVVAAAMDHVAAGRSVAIICPARCLLEISAWLREEDLPWRRPGEDQTGPVITLLTPRESKGLEFDVAVVVEPGFIVDDDPRGHRLLYIALTRATAYLHLVGAPDDLPVVEYEATPADDAPSGGVELGGAGSRGTADAASREIPQAAPMPGVDVESEPAVQEDRPEPQRTREDQPDPQSAQEVRPEPKPERDDQPEFRPAQEERLEPQPAREERPEPQLAREDQLESQPAPEHRPEIQPAREDQPHPQPAQEDRLDPDDRPEPEETAEARATAEGVSGQVAESPFEAEVGPEAGAEVAVARSEQEVLFNSAVLAELRGRRSDKAQRESPYQPRSEAEAQTEPKAQTGTEAQTGKDAQTEANDQAGADARTETNDQAEASAQTEMEAQAEADTQPIPAAHAEQEGRRADETLPGPQSQAGLDAEANTHAALETQPDAAQAVASAQTELTDQPAPAAEPSRPTDEALDEQRPQPEAVAQPEPHSAPEPKSQAQPDQEPQHGQAIRQPEPAQPPATPPRASPAGQTGQPHPLARPAQPKLSPAVAEGLAAAQRLASAARRMVSAQPGQPAQTGQPALHGQPALQSPTAMPPAAPATPASTSATTQQPEAAQSPHATPPVDPGARPSPAPTALPPGNRPSPTVQEPGAALPSPDAAEPQPAPEENPPLPAEELAPLDPAVREAIDMVAHRMAETLLANLTPELWPIALERVVELINPDDWAS